MKEISDLYEKHVPSIMKAKKPRDKSLALAALGKAIFKDDKFDKMKTGIGIVTTKWVIERPMIFKTSIEQAHGRMGTFFPGFGVTISDAVQASCSAYPFFERKTVKTEHGDLVELIDGGYCANNPTLYAIADAIMALKLPPEHIRVKTKYESDVIPGKKAIFIKGNGTRRDADVLACAKLKLHMKLWRYRLAKRRSALSRILVKIVSK